MRGTCSASRGASCPTAENQLDTWQRAFEPQALSAIVDSSRSREHMNTVVLFPSSFSETPEEGSYGSLSLMAAENSGQRCGRPELGSLVVLSSFLFFSIIWFCRFRDSFLQLPCLPPYSPHHHFPPYYYNSIILKQQSQVQHSVI